MFMGREVAMTFVRWARCRILCNFDCDRSDFTVYFILIRIHRALDFSDSFIFAQIVLCLVYLQWRYTSSYSHDESYKRWCCVLLQYCWEVTEERDILTVSAPWNSFLYFCLFPDILMMLSTIMIMSETHKSPEIGRCLLCYPVEEWKLLFNKKV